MPIYEYECRKCGHRLESLQKISEDPLKDCPQCKEPELQRLISAAAFHLKGSGWYKTDFRDKGKPAGKEKDKDKAKDKKDSGESKSEAACGAGACPACVD